MIAIPKKTSQIAEGYEGLGGYNAKLNRYFPYHGKRDKPGTMTIGRGHVVKTAEAESGKFKDGLTLAQVDELYAQDMQSRAERLHKLMLGKYTEDQFAAALSMFYNIEKAWNPDMTPGRNHRLGKSEECAKGMLLYILDENQKRTLGLWRRRMSEALCYLTGEVMVAKDDASEKKLEARLRQLIDFKRPLHMT